MKRIQVMIDEEYMKRALEQAQMAFDRDEVPVGAVVVCRDRIIARAHNLTETLNDVTAHEVCKSYVTVEPCVMCAGAIGWSQLGRLVYGAADPKRGFSVYAPKALHPRTEIVGGVMAEECGGLMTSFFKRKR